MITENISTLRIHKLSQEQYDRENDAGTLEDNAIYITPSESVPAAILTSGTGSAYKATVPNIKALDTGVSFVMIPHTTSTSIGATLNVNGLGAKGFRCRLNNKTTVAVLSQSSWALANKPIRVIYDGTYWIVEGLSKSSASDLNGTVSISNGGTGATTAAAALTNLGLTATATELNYMDGATSNVQTQLDNIKGFKNFLALRDDGTTKATMSADSSSDTLKFKGKNIDIDFFHDANYVKYAEFSVPVDDAATIEEAIANIDIENSTNPISTRTFYSIVDSLHTNDPYMVRRENSIDQTAGGLVVGSMSTDYTYNDLGLSSLTAGLSSAAIGTSSIALGAFNIARDFQTVVGKYADTSSDSKKGASSLDGTGGSLFVVGNGTSDNKRSNVFRVSAAGTCYGLNSFASSGADFAEYFEWVDGNPNDEDRRGRFVTLDGDKIRYANAEDDYILGVVSTIGAFIGNTYSEIWQGRYLTDEFGDLLTEEVEIPEETIKREVQKVVNKLTGEIITETITEVIPAHIETRYILNPDYDPEREYVSREFRKEWSPVGFHGQVVVIDDGTCQVNGYCKPSIDGTATTSETGYRVMTRIDDTHIKVLVK